MMNITDNPNQGEREMDFKSAKIEGQELWIVWNDQGTDQGATIHLSEDEAKDEAEFKNDEAWSKFE